MDRKNTASLAALAALGAALAFGSALPATAAKEPPVPPPPAEAGCYNLDGPGVPSYQRLVSTITQAERVPATPVTTALYDQAVITESSRGFVTGNMSLEGPSCPEATYVLEVYKATPEADGSYALLARNAVRGDGVRPVLFLDTAVRGNDAMSVRVTGYVQDAYGRVIDSSDRPLGQPGALITALDDALPPPGSGGSQFWG